MFAIHPMSLQVAAQYDLIVMSCDTLFPSLLYLRTDAGDMEGRSRQCFHLSTEA